MSKQQKKDVYKKVDLSYKDNALRVTYDIESTPDLFTLAMIHNDAFGLMFFGDEQFDDLSEEELLDQMKLFAKKEDTLKDMKKDKPEDIDLNVYKYQIGNKKDMDRLEDDLLTIICCYPLDGDKKFTKHAKSFVEYCGWNSARYDLDVIILTYLLVKKKKERLSPQSIRHLSNYIIQYQGPPYKFGEYIEEKTKGLIKKQSYHYYKNMALWSDGHIDWAKIAKKEDGGDEAMMPPGLKKEMARFGMDIIFDETIADDSLKIWSNEERDHLVDYNFNDVLGTKVISELDLILEGIASRDIVRNMYSYTSAKYTPIEGLKKWEPAARDTTAADLAARVLIGPKRIKPQDWDKIKYQFPVPTDSNDPTNDDKKEFVDLWDKMKETEEFIPRDLDLFFTHFRDKDTRNRYDDMQVKKTQPVSHKSALNIPYYRDGKPQDSFIRVSTGGAHGSVYAGLSEKTSDEITAWTRSDADIKDDQKPTIDKQDIVHIDWSSFYPVMCSKMEIYKTKENVDRYTSIIQGRFKQKPLIKKMRAEGVPEDDPELARARWIEAGFKFILNNATGAGNTHKKYALLPVDNKTLSMRLVGNMHIWCLGQRLTQAGAYVISTNTDGLYICNLTVDESQKVIDEYIKEYGMGVDPEPLKRFINRDTSNRIEFGEDPKDVELVKGLMTHGQHLEFISNVSLGKNVKYPLASAHAAIRYMAEDENWLTKPYNKDQLREIINEIYHDKNVGLDAWYHIYSGTKSRRLLYDDEIQQKISRVIFTVDGKKISNETNQQFSKNTSHYLARQLQINSTITKDQLKMLKIEGPPKLSGPFENLDFNHKDVKIDFVEKYQPDPSTHKTWQPLGIDIYHSDLILKYQSLGDSKDDEKENVQRKIDGDALKILGYYNPKDEKWYPFKMWKESKITDYTSDVGEIFNTAQSLKDFDIDQHIDLDAYFRWAENLLDNWKVTANIPEISLQSHDDTVVEGKKTKRTTKKDIEIDILKSYYGLKEKEGAS